MWLGGRYIENQSRTFKDAFEFRTCFRVEMKTAYMCIYRISGAKLPDGSDSRWSVIWNRHCALRFLCLANQQRRFGKYKVLRCLNKTGRYMGSERAGGRMTLTGQACR